MRRLATALALTASLAIPASAVPAAAATFHSGDGLQLVSVKRLNPRLEALVVKTAALPRPANVYILLPPGYDSHPTRRYPVFYLLHGTSGTASDWTKQGDAQRVIGNRQLITVMPDIALGDGGGGWCTDWPGGAQRWETFHIGQLVPWVDANLRTIRSRGARAIAGLSQGGFCSTTYAARHPDLFGTVLSYSGAPDIYYDLDARSGALLIINATEFFLDGVAPDTFFGNPVTNGINWAAHDPTTLATNLRWTKILLYSGNGMPGPYDRGVNAGGSGIEGLVYRDTIDFHNRLVALAIPSLYDLYGNGTHSWPYWTRDLRWSIDRIMAAFAHPAPAPASFSYMSADAGYAVYGWRVAVRRAVREFSKLLANGSKGFTLSGSGSATVVTPPRYVAGMPYSVAVAGRWRRLTADRSGRLTIVVALGPSNTTQQYAVPGSTAVYSTKVTIAPTKAVIAPTKAAIAR